MPKYIINRSFLNNLAGCKTEWQLSNTYCSLGKLAVCATGEFDIIDHPCYQELGIVCFSPKAEEFLTDVKQAIGQENFRKIMELNDLPGDFKDTHFKSLEMALDLLEKSGLIEIVEEKSELLV